jgi:hypothetical protein
MRFTILPSTLGLLGCLGCLGCHDDGQSPERLPPAMVMPGGGREGAEPRVSAASGADAGEGGAGGSEPLNRLANCSLELPFAHQTGRGYWLGSDGASSLALSPTRALVTFRDSFVGGPSKLSRAQSQLVSNSIASVSCEAGDLGVEYAWGGNGHAHAALFDDGNPRGERLWLQRPWLHEGKLFITAIRLAETEQGPAERGTTLIRVADPSLPVPAWSVEYFDLTAQPVGIGKGVVATDEHVVLFVGYDQDLRLTRIAKERLLEASISEGSLEHLREDGSWQSGLDLARAKPLGLPAGTGLSVRWHEPSGRLLALFSDTSTWPTPRVSISSARAPEGPWSTPSLIYSVPEMNPLAPEYESDLYCYGAAEHEAFNALADHELFFSYACASANFAKLVQNVGIFVPRLVRLPLPPTF